MRRKKEYCKYIASLLLFGSNGIIAEQIALSSSEIVFWRTLIGSLLLIGIYCFRNRERPPAVTREVISRRMDLLCVILSGVSMGLSWIFLYAAYGLVGVSLSSLAYYCGPVIVMVLSPLLFHEKLTSGSVIGFITVFIGVVMTNGAVGKSVDRIGIAFGFASAAAHALMVIFSKKARNMKGLENPMIQLMCSFLTAMVYVGMRNGWGLPTGASSWGWLIVLGLVNTGIGCYLYFSSICFLSVQSVSVLGYLEPLSAVFLAVILLDEHMTVLQCIGTMLIIGGALLGD